MNKKAAQVIRSSAAEYLTFIAASGGSEEAIEMRYEDENIWLTQKMMAQLYDVEVHTINEHIKKIFADDEFDAEQPHMELTSWELYPDGKIQKYDVSVMKNYLSQDELQALERIVSMYLDYAEYQAGRHIPMTMEDWAVRLDRFLEFNEHEILQDSGRVTHEIAKSFAESQFEKYRIVQDKLFQNLYR